MRKLLFLGALALTLLALFLGSSGSSGFLGVARRAPNPSEELRGTPRNPEEPAPTGRGEAREKWLFEQRAYPFGEVPADGRRKALEQVRARERERIASHATAAAINVRWKALGPQPLQVRFPFQSATGRVKALAVSPVNPSLVLAGSSSGGIWRSIDAGATFTPVSDHHADLSVGTIAFAPSNPSLVYAVSGSDFLGTGVLKSLDAGATWQLANGPTFAPRGTANRMVVDPSNENRLWVAQTSKQDATTGNTLASGLLRSDDGGFSWTQIFRGIPTDFTAAPGSVTTFILGVSRHDGGGTPGVYRTTDAGQTWTQVFAGVGTSPRFFIAFAPSQPSRVYLSSYMGGINRIHVSDDGGVTWMPLTMSLPSRRQMFLAVHPANPSQLYLGFPGGDLYDSPDGGTTWRNVTKNLDAADRFTPGNALTHIDQHAIAFSPIDANTFYLGNDGGIYKTTDGATTFTSLASTLSLIQAYGVTAHPLQADLIYLGTQDNGLARQRDGVWREVITGDYGSIHFDPNNPSILLTNYVYGEINALTQYGDGSWSKRTTSATFFEQENNPRIEFIAPFEHHRLTNTLYFGTWRLFRSTNFGLSWTAPANMTDLTKGVNDTLTAIGLAANDQNTIYTGSRQGRVMISRDGGTNWTDITGALPQRYIRAIEVDRQQPNVAWIAFSGYRIAHVYRTTDYGATWQSMSEDLPDIPVNALFIDPSNRNILYAGTDIGPFRMDLGASTRWQYIGTGMPPVIVTAFDVTANGKIIAATYGRGAYELAFETGPKRRSTRH